MPLIALRRVRGKTRPSDKIEQRTPGDHISGAVLVREFRRNCLETVRIRLGWFQQSGVIDIRTWTADASGEARPTPTGLMLSVRHLPALAAAVVEAERLARANGMLPTPDGAGSGHADG